MNDMHQAVRLYAGKVMHQRLNPFGHRFAYRVFSFLLDLDRLPEAARLTPLFSVNRFNLAAFYETDHIDARISPPELGIRSYADQLFENSGMSRPQRIELLAYPRIFGHAFNPISVYYAYGTDKLLSGVIYEVRNTFGERHTYVCPVSRRGTDQCGIAPTAGQAFSRFALCGHGRTLSFSHVGPGRKTDISHF